MILLVGAVSKCFFLWSEVQIPAIRKSTRGGKTYEMDTASIGRRHGQSLEADVPTNTLAILT